MIILKQNNEDNFVGEESDQSPCICASDMKSNEMYKRRCYQVYSGK